MASATSFPVEPGFAWRTRILSFITDQAVVDHIIAHLRRTRPGLFPPARGSPTLTPTETCVCRADADGFIYAQDLPPDE